jgi:HK97 family phage major capsid protein
MPTAAEQKKAGMVSIKELQSTLVDLKERAEACVAEAEELDQLAQSEKRELTYEEEARIEQLLEESEQLKAQYELQLQEDRRATIRANLDIGRERVASLPEPEGYFSTGLARRVTHVLPRSQQDPRRGFIDLGEFCALVFASGLPNGTIDERLSRLRLEAAATGMSQGVGADAGIAVPPQFRQEIWQGMQKQVDNLLEMTDQYPVTGESLTLRANAETNRTTGSRYGGIRGYWLAEAAQMTASSPKLRQLKLEPQELAVLVYVTDRLLRNAPALTEFVRRAASEEILFLINDAILNGGGVGKPLGVNKSGGLVTVAAEPGQAAQTIVLENINNMWTRMFAGARPGSVWLINQDVEPQLESLSAVVGTGGFPVYLPAGAAGPTITEAPNARLKGRPVLPVEYCETLGTQGDIMLVNLNYYATGIQGTMRDDMSIHLRFDYNETAFRFLFAMDGQPWLNAPLTPFHGTNTLSPFVALATRS